MNPSLQFRLDQDEIQQLLMGETLYGDPTLAIRELLQNALDALQMRDLRLKLLRKDPKAAVEPTDLLPENEELAVRLTWGKDPATGQEFIRVADNGTGMTQLVLEKFFTQIGKSYYRSPDFVREQALLRGSGLFATPISHFGIGILSCFMIGDRLEVRTRPGRADTKGREAFDVTVSGPGSLFWLRPGTLESQGTEVTVYLKSRFRLSVAPDKLIKRLKQHFQYEKHDFEFMTADQAEAKAPGPTPVDPPLIAAKHVVWPLYPILAGPSGSPPEVRIDDTFHFRELNPIAVDRVQSKAGEWYCTPAWLGDLQWQHCDWIDDQPCETATGSRVRFTFPRHSHSDFHGPCDPPPDSSLCQQDEIAALVETSLTMQSRIQTLVRGIGVADTSKLDDLIPVGPGMGSYLWVDLRGAASPRLTGDGTMALPGADAQNWQKAVAGVFQRWADFVGKHFGARGPHSRHWQNQLAWKWSRWPVSQDTAANRISLLTPIFGSWPSHPSTAAQRLQWLPRRFLASLGLARERDSTLDRALDHARDLGLVRFLDRERVLAGHVASARDLTRDFTRDLGIALDFARSLAGASAGDLTGRGAGDRRRDLDQLLAASKTQGPCTLLPLHLECVILAEAFQPCLERSFPPLGCGSLRGAAGNGVLTAPVTIDFVFESDGRTAATADPGGREPAALVRLGYDLVFPLTNIPLGRLRRELPAWRTDRAIRPLGVLPFFFAQHTDAFLKHARTLSTVFRVPLIQVLMPKPELWGKPFAEWSAGDWNTCGLSAIWDIPTGRVLWAEGAHTTEELRRIGKPFAELLKSQTTPQTKMP